MGSSDIFLLSIQLYVFLAPLKIRYRSFYENIFVVSIYRWEKKLLIWNILLLGSMLFVRTINVWDSFLKYPIDRSQCTDVWTGCLKPLLQSLQNWNHYNKNKAQLHYCAILLKAAKHICFNSIRSKKRTYAIYYVTENENPGLDEIKKTHTR